MNNTVFLALLLPTGIVLGGTISSWLEYQAVSNPDALSLKLTWFGRMRWLFTTLMVVLAVVGFFAILKAASNVGPLNNKPLDLPEEINTVSDDWGNPTQLQAYQDHDVIHLRFKPASHFTAPDTLYGAADQYMTHLKATQHLYYLTVFMDSVALYDATYDAGHGAHRKVGTIALGTGALSALILSDNQ